MEKIEVISEETKEGRICLKVPSIEIDDFGNEVTMYRKEYIDAEQLDAQIASRKEVIADCEKMLLELEEKKKLVESIKVPEEGAEKKEE